jgi:hypothetical protein
MARWADGRAPFVDIFSCWVQPLHQQVITLWLHPRPGCPDLPFYKEVGDVEINTWIHKVQAHGGNLNHGAGTAP